MNTLDAILTRRSCREFTDQPIENETLHQLLEAAMSGPSCVNAQDWSFAVVTDPEKLAQMADANGRPEHLPCCTGAGAWCRMTRRFLVQKYLCKLGRGSV